MILKADYNGKEITFDDLEYQFMDRVEHSTFFECRGYDERGNVYAGSVERCCDEYEPVTDIELIIHARNIEKKPYQARILLKSIRHWQSVVNGAMEPKRPMAYYVNKLDWYTDGDIVTLEKIAKQSAIKGHERN